LQRLDNEQQKLFSVILWSLWKCRNNQVWDNVTDTAQTVCERAQHLLMSWKTAQQVRSLATTSLPTVTHRSEWTRPSSGRYKCNIDASFSHSLKELLVFASDFGAIVRDC
jgi:ABC-type anion transport system duplicated permease subunit